MMTATLLQSPIAFSPPTPPPHPPPHRRFPAPHQKWRVLEAMKDDERTELIIRMSLPFRAEARANLDPKLWDRTMDVVRAHSSFGARWVVMSRGWRLGAGVGFGVAGSCEYPHLHIHIPLRAHTHATTPAPTSKPQTKPQPQTQNPNPNPPKVPLLHGHRRGHVRVPHLEPLPPGGRAGCAGRLHGGGGAGAGGPRAEEGAADDAGAVGGGQHCAGGVAVMMVMVVLEGCTCGRLWREKPWFILNRLTDRHMISHQPLQIHIDRPPNRRHPSQPDHAAPAGR